jgi:hypothetical protein
MVEGSGNGSANAGHGFNDPFGITLHLAPFQVQKRDLNGAL